LEQPLLNQAVHSAPLNLLILEEQLYNTNSHHYNYYSSILAGAAAAGVQLRIIANRQASDSVKTRLGGEARLFTMAGLSANQQEHVGNKFWRSVLLFRNLIGNFFICRSLIACQKRPDAVLCLSTWIPHVLLFVFLAILAGRKMPKVGLLFVWYPKLGGKPANSFLLVRLLVQLLHRIHRETFIFAETTYAQKAWQEFLGLPVRYVVHPVEVAELAEENAEKLKEGGTTNHTKTHERGEAGPCLDNTSGAAFSNPFTSELARDSENTSPTCSASAPASSPATSYPPLATSASPLVFGFYGFARHEQGVDVLMRALEILKSQGEWVSEFRIVWPQAFQMPDGSWLEPKMFEHLTDKVRFFEKALSPLEYLKQLSETDWLVLPYRVRSYQGRCSRISIEASVLGIPVIYTNGTDLEEVITKHGAGIGVLEENAAALAATISEARRKIGLFADSAAARKASARQFFSGLEFIRTMLQQ